MSLSRLAALLLLPVVALGMPAAALAAGPLKIAMVLWRGETEAEQGFRERLKELGHTTEYVVMNANQDRGELGRLLREDLLPRVDTFHYVYAYGTTVMLAAKSVVPPKVPLLFNIVADPVGAGIVPSLERSGANVAGASNAVPMALQLKTATAVFPIRRLGLFFNPREKNAMLMRDQVLAVAKTLGIEVVDLRSPPAQDMLQENLRKLRDGSVVVDAVYLPADSFMVSSAKLIGAELRAAKVKSIAALDTFVDQGALMGVVPQYRELGQALAGIVHRHVGGQRLADMPIEVDRDPVLRVNVTTSRALGVTIPDALMKRAVRVE